MSRGRPANSSAWVTYCLRCLFREGDTGEVLPPARYLMRAKDFVDAHYAEPIIVDHLATAAGLADICAMVGLTSVGSFTTTFTRVCGRPPTAYRAAMPPAATHARVPGCILRLHTRPAADSRVKTAHGEKTSGVERG